jgi:hypothetical protein
MRMIQLKGGEIALDIHSKTAVQRHGDIFIVLGDGLYSGSPTKSNSYDLRAAKMRSVQRVDLTSEEIATRLEVAKK